MKTFIKMLLIILIPSSLISCASNKTSRLCAHDNGAFYECNDLKASRSNNSNMSYSSPSAFSPNLHFQLLSEYTEQMAAELQKDLIGVEIETPIVVASFVYFDSTLNRTNNLGNQLAEYFINDLQEIGLPVSDHRIAKTFKISPEGDFTFSRNMSELKTNIEIGYVLTGTLVKNDRGVVVNARLINYKTNVIAASTSKFLPNIAIRDII